MRKTTYCIVLISLLAVSGISTVAQTYNQPREVPIDRLVRQNFPKFYVRGSHAALIPESFFPIGWSKDGRFAYYVEPVDEACGCYYANVVIQDMRTDKVVWKFEYDQGDEDDPVTGKRMGHDNIRELWKANQKMFSEKLAENGIVASRSVMLGKTFTAGGNFTAKAVKKMGANPDGYEARVNLYTVSLSSPKLGSKNVFLSEDKTKEEYWFMLDAGVIGVIKSPYENRVAIIAVEAMRGYEGPPHTGELRIVGADLVSGFRK